MTNGTAPAGSALPAVAPSLECCDPILESRHDCRVADGWVDGMMGADATGSRLGVRDVDRTCGDPTRRNARPAAPSHTRRNSRSPTGMRNGLRTNVMKLKPIRMIAAVPMMAPDQPIEYM